MENSEQNLDNDALKFRNLGKIQNHLISKIWKFTTQNLVSGGKITLSNYACLPQFNDMDDAQQGHTAWVYGWGKFGDRTGLSKVLQETMGEVITQQICEQKWKLTSVPRKIQAFHMCFDNPAGKGFFIGPSCPLKTGLQGGRSWQAFGERKKMPSILSSGAYLLIRDKKHCFFAYYQNRNKKGSFYLVFT